MEGIQLDKPILYKGASLRFFNKGERHVTRFCKDDVLLLVYDGVLRFSEDMVPKEIHAGQYYIQRHDTYQSADIQSDSPKYLYVHFLALWQKGSSALPKSGVFEYANFKTLIEQLDTLAHTKAPYIEKAAKFYELLVKLNQPRPQNTTAGLMADFASKECQNQISLDTLSQRFHFSKNQIINIFKKEFGVTPITYINNIRLEKAEYLIEVTSNPLESIALNCGFQNYSHFYKLFYQKHKLSPNQWRSKKRMG